MGIYEERGRWKAEMGQRWEWDAHSGASRALRVMNLALILVMVVSSLCWCYEESLWLTRYIDFLVEQEMLCSRKMRRLCSSACRTP